MAGRASNNSPNNSFLPGMNEKDKSAGRQAFNRNNNAAKYPTNRRGEAAAMGT